MFRGNREAILIYPEIHPIIDTESRELFFCCDSVGYKVRHGERFHRAVFDEWNGGVDTPQYSAGLPIVAKLCCSRVQG